MLGEEEAGAEASRERRGQRESLPWLRVSPAQKMKQTGRPWSHLTPPPGADGQSLLW